MMALCCLAACNNDIDGPQRKERVDIPLTKTEKDMVEQGHVFACGLYRLVHEGKAKPTDNVIISPLSASLAFAMLNNGAAGETGAEIKRVLGFESFSTDELNGYYRKMLEAAVTLDPQVTLESANSIWIQNSFPVKAPFVDVNKQYFNAEVRNVNFGDAKTLGLINNWVSDKTHGMIKDMLTQLPSVMSLINAMYFEADWKTPFEAKNTKNKPFTNVDGSVSSVPMMHQTVETRYVETGQFEAAVFPYGNEAFSMTVLLPKEGVTLASVANDLSAETIGQLRWENAAVITEFPRFTTEFSMGMIPYLQKLGMQLPFSSQADFSLISDVPTFVNMVDQKAHISVDEKGTKAAVATHVGMDLMAPGPSQSRNFRINRPFLYMIREYSSGTIYFMGEVNKL